jgi:probable HAF family extracellular repeat protein
MSPAHAVRKVSRTSLRFRQRLAVECLEPRYLLSYRVTDLGDMETSNSLAHAVNESGAAVGYDVVGGSLVHAMLWDSGGNVDLGALCGPFSYADGVNTDRQVVGYRAVFNPVGFQAFYWDDAGGVQDLGTFGGDSSFAYGINDEGEVVGQADLVDGTSHAFLWDQTNGLQELGTLGGPSSVANAVNNSGVVAGGADGADGSHHAVLWKRHRVRDLGTLGGDNSEASAVNNLGHAAGSSQTAMGAYHAFYWERGIGMQDLGTFGGESSVAFGINASDQVVGWAQSPTDGFRAFVWDNGTLADLNDLILDPGWTLNIAFAINNAGQIVGVGRGPNSSYDHAFLLNPDDGALAGRYRFLASAGPVAAAADPASRAGSVDHFQQNASMPVLGTNVAAPLLQEAAAASHVACDNPNVGVVVHNRTVGGFVQAGWFDEDIECSSSICSSVTAFASC